MTTTTARKPYPIKHVEYYGEDNSPFYTALFDSYGHNVSIAVAEKICAQHFVNFEDLQEEEPYIADTRAGYIPLLPLLVTLGY